MPKSTVIHAALLALLLAGPAGPTRADDRPPADAAPPAAVMQRAQAEFPGRILKVEYEDEDDAPSGGMYEVKILQDDGVVVEVEYDAVTLERLKVEKGDDWRKDGRRDAD